MIPALTDTKQNLPALIQQQHHNTGVTIAFSALVTLPAHSILVQTGTDTLNTTQLTLLPVTAPTLALTLAATATLCQH